MIWYKEEKLVSVVGCRAGCPWCRSTIQKFSLVGWWIVVPGLVNNTYATQQCHALNMDFHRLDTSHTYLPHPHRNSRRSNAHAHIIIPTGCRSSTHTYIYLDLRHQCRVVQDTPRQIISRLNVALLMSTFIRSAQFKTSSICSIPLSV